MTRRPDTPTTDEAGATLRLALERARQDLLAAFDAKRDADTRFMAAVAAYEARAEACRSAARAPDPVRPARRTGA
jgi:hypothetical protein